MGYYEEGLFTKGDSQSVGIREPQRMAPWPELARAELVPLPRWKGRREAVTDTLRNSHRCCSVGGSGHSLALQGRVRGVRRAEVEHILTSLSSLYNPPASARFPPI